MSKLHGYGSLRRLIRCAGCRNHYDESIVKQVNRLQEHGTVPLCPDCWWDILQAVRTGGHDMGALLEQLVDAVPPGA